MPESFRWASPLGASVVMFTAIGAFWVLIGLLAAPLHKKGNPDYLFISRATDTAFYGAPPSELAPSGSPLAKFRTLLITIVSGFLVLCGALFVFVALFGLRRGQAWALVALGLSGLAAVVFWAIALLPYFQARITIGLGDIPPFMWLPAALVPPAVVLGWLGLR